MEEKRLFVGGLFNGIKEADVKERFSQFGTVTAVDIREKTDLLGDLNTFAYINFNTDRLNKCISTFNNTKWKGKTLKVQLAKENFLDRLKTERLSESTAVEKQGNEVLKTTDILHKTFQGKPGTETGEKNWVVDKFGKAVPVVYIRRKDKHKVMKVDPTTMTKSRKQFTDSVSKADTGALTWQLPEADGVEARKKRGIFPRIRKKAKRSAETPAVTVQHERSDGGGDGAGDGAGGGGQDGDFLIVPLKSNAENKELFTPVGERSRNIDGYDSADSADTDEILSLYNQRKGAPEYTVNRGVVGKNGVSNGSEEKSQVKKSKRKGEKSEKITSRDSRAAVPNDPVPSNSVPSDPVLSDPEFAFLFESDSSDDEKNIGKSERKAAKKPGIPVFQGTKMIEGFYTDPVSSDFVIPSGERSPASKKGRAGKYMGIVGPEHDEHAGKCDKQTGHSATSSGPSVGTSAPTVGGETYNSTGNKKSKAELSLMHDTADNIKLENVTERGSTEAGKMKKKSEKIPKPTKQQKRLSSDQKRLETMKERLLENKAKVDVIKKALSSVDSGTAANKRVVFDSSDSEEDVDHFTSLGNTGPSKKSGVEQRKSLDLFGSGGSSEDERSDDEGERFRIKPQFEGKQGQRLMSLQSRFQNDERFKLTEQFLDSESEGEADPPEPSSLDAGAPGNDDPDDLQGERLRSLDILKKVVGGDVSKVKARKDKTASLRDISVVRFDPTNEEHQKMVIHKEPAKKKVKKKVKTPEPVKEPEPVPEVSTEKFSEVAAPLSSLFGQGNPHVKFSFLGSDSEDDVEENAAEKATGSTSSRVGPAPDQPMSWEQSFKCESSSDEERGEDSGTNAAAPMVETSEETRTRRKTFFFTVDDPRIKEGIQFFRRHDTIEKIRELWEERRDKLVEDYRSKHKKAMRRNRLVSSLKKKPYQR